MKLKNVILSVGFVLFSSMLLTNCNQPAGKDKPAAKDTTKKVAAAVAKEDTVAAPVVYPPIDKKLYDLRCPCLPCAAQLQKVPAITGCLHYPGSKPNSPHVKQNGLLLCRSLWLGLGRLGGFRL